MTACTVCSWSLAARAEGNCGPDISGKDTIPFEYTILFRSTLSAVPVEPAVDHDSTISCACAEVVITEATSMRTIEKLRMFDFMFLSPIRVLFPARIKRRSKVASETMIG